MKRNVVPEILDSLPSDDPTAIASRRDLRLINQIMGNRRWMTKQLLSHLKPGDRILEIGPGDGRFGRFFNNRFSHRFSDYAGIDLSPRPIDWPENRKWFQDDIIGFDNLHGFTVLIGNLIFHHLEDIQLTLLGRKIRSSGIRLVLASETARHRLHQWQLFLLRPLRLSSVTKHDARVSIDAGFRKNELPSLLGLKKPEWLTETRHTFFGASRMIAQRAENNPR